MFDKIYKTIEEFDKIVFRPGKQHTEYRTDKLFIILRVLRKLHLIRLA